jgi:hypothetical protein
MIRAMTSQTATRRLVAITVSATIAAVVIGCGNTAATAQPSEPQATGAAAPSVDAAACPVETPPGPDDLAAGGAGGDALGGSEDFGGGRWRLCLAEPVAFSVEGSARCVWTDDRSEVREVSGLPTPIGAAGSTVDGGVALDRGQVYLASNDSRMISSWQGEASDMSAVVGVAGMTGTASFRIPATVDQDNPPAVRPPAAAGVMSWECGDPPPPAT